MLSPQELADFSNKISNMIGFLSRVTTNELGQAKSRESEYQEFKKPIDAYFAKLGVVNPNPFKTLANFTSFTSSQFSHWSERRNYVKQLYGSILDTVTIAMRNNKPLELKLKISEGFECKPIFQQRKFKEMKMCFVLMPFKPNFGRIYEEVIKPTIEKRGYEVLKADELYTTSPIIEDIWTKINECQTIIADVTGKNPNVFYELGIAHTVGKRTIILSQNDDDVPFDLRYLRYYKYDDTQSGWINLKSCLEKIQIE
jgi:hypothetical protein